MVELLNNERELKISELELSDIIAAASSLGNLETNVLAYISSKGKSDSYAGIEIDANIGASNIKRLYNHGLLTEINSKELQDLFYVSVEYLEDPDNYPDVIINHLHQSRKKLVKDIMKNIVYRE